MMTYSRIRQRYRKIEEPPKVAVEPVIVTKMHVENWSRVDVVPAIMAVGIGTVTAVIAVAPAIIDMLALVPIETEVATDIKKRENLNVCICMAQFLNMHAAT